MNEFVLIFRMDLTTPGAQPTQEQLDAYMVEWTAWLDGLAAQGRLADTGNHFSTDGAVLRKGSRSPAIYSADRESVAGYLSVYAESLDEAVVLASACPILGGDGTSVEVRGTGAPGTV